MKSTKTLIALASIVCSVSSHAMDLIDNFDSAQDYTTGYTGGVGSGNVAGTIWDGFEYNNGFDGTQNTLVTTAANAGGTLNFSSSDGNFEGGPDDGMFLYTNVAGGSDFTVTVELADYTYIDYHTAAIMARSTAGPGPRYVQCMYLDAFGVGGQLRATIDGGTANINSGNEPYSTGMKLQLIKSGAVFTARYLDAADNLLGSDSRVIPELETADLQVGLAQATFVGNTGNVSFDNFELAFTTDNTPPMITPNLPASGSDDIRTTLYRFDADEPVLVGTGNITIFRSADNSVFATIDVESADVAIIDTTRVFFEAPALEPDTSYYVNIDAGAIVDPAGNEFGGLVDTSWNFSSAATNPFEVRFIQNELDIENLGGEVLSAANFGPTSGGTTDVTLNGIFHPAASDGAGDVANLIPELTVLTPGFQGYFRNAPAVAAGYTGGLENLFSSIAGAGGNPPAMRIEITGLTPGAFYLFQGYWEANNFGQLAQVTFEGTDTLTGIPGAGDPPLGTLIAYSFVATDDTLTVELSKVFGADAIWWSGYSLQSLPSAPALAIERTSTGFDFSWDGVSGLQYDLLSSTDLSTPIASWPVYSAGGTTYENIPGVDGTDVLSIPTPPEDRRFFALREEEAPPFFSEDFESGAGDFTATTVAGTLWEYGMPDSSGFAGAVESGNNGSANCWGTNLGAFGGGSGDPGYYVDPTTVSRLLSPVIDLSSLGGATLSFAQSLDFAPGDTAVVNVIDVSTGDPVTFGDFPLTITDTNEASVAWENAGTYALPVGGAIRIEWLFSGTGGDFDDYLGWYIDDVVIEPAAP